MRRLPSNRHSCLCSRTDLASCSTRELARSILCADVCGTQCCDPAASDPRNGACFTDPDTGIVGCPPVSFVCVDNPASPNYNCDPGPNGEPFKCCPNTLGVNECVQLGTEAHCSDCNACANGQTCCSGSCTVRQRVCLLERRLTPASCSVWCAGSGDWHARNILATCKQLRT